MSHHEVELLVISSSVALERIEEVLGKSYAGGHSFGSPRANGSVRQQSMWVKLGEAEAELMEEYVDQLLDWFCEKREALRKVDPAAFCKICCKLRTGDDQDGFVVNPGMARKLVDLDVVLLLDIYSP